MSNPSDDATVDGAGGAAPRSDEARRPSPSRGETIDRYVVLSELGRGGMGVVYAAYDPELDRKVALKLVRPDAAGTDGAARLLREAQALAKLSHPNVVAIHDVGARDDEVWLAMEFVAGRTLTDWLAERRRSWSEVLDVVRPAAQGLAAAHEVGLIHRDVKPDNIMLGDDGRIRVMDFGLARGRREGPTEPPAASAERSERTSKSSLGDALTRAGATPGTPAYMSPEQISGDDTDARTDQFSLCVTIWQAIYGQRPFRGDSLITLATAVLAGDRAPPPREIRIPRWLRSAVDRGLAVRAEDRWPSLSALLDAFDRGRRRARITRGAVGVSVVGLGVAAAFGVRALRHQQRIARCETDGAVIDQVWNDARRAEVTDGLLATGASNAAVTADKVMPWIDEQADAWRSARTEACLDTTVRDRWDAATLDRAVWCLDERRLELDALVRRLADADARAVENAVIAAADLQPVAPCRDEAQLSRLPVPSDDARVEITAVRGELAETNAIAAAGAYGDALERARGSLQRAEALQWSPIVAAARLQVGALLDETAAYAEAEAMLESAYFTAAQAAAPVLAVAAARQLTFTVGFRLARHDDGRRWFRHAEVARAQLPDAAGLQEAGNLAHVAAVDYGEGAHESARAALSRALEIRERALGPDHPSVAATVDRLGLVLQGLGDYDEAAKLHQRALESLERALGPEHPAVASALGNVALASYATGAYADAAKAHARALAIQQAVHGPTHPLVATASSNLALAREKLGEDEEAAALHERALAIREETLGPEHPAVAQSMFELGKLRIAMGALDEGVRMHERALAIAGETLDAGHPDLGRFHSGLGGAYRARGSFEDARVHYQRALEIFDEALGPDHPVTAATIDNLGAVLLDQGSYAEAADYYERARALTERTLGPDHPDLARALAGLARIAIARDRPDDAVPLAEQALRITGDGDAVPDHVAQMRFLLARALAAGGGDLDRARELAEQARAVYRDEGDDASADLAEVEAFLRHHAQGR